MLRRSQRSRNTRSAPKLLLGSRQCINQTNGDKGQFIQFWAHTTQGEPNNDWNIWQVSGHHTVDCAAGFPFSAVPSSVCNSWGYNGLNVWKIAWAPNRVGSGYCIWAGGYDDSDYFSVDTTVCSPDHSTVETYLFVEVEHGYLVSADATNYQFLGGNDRRVYLGTCQYASNRTSDGSPICLTYSNPVGWYVTSPA
jgi:hypothetical protein